jgi:hypothetical protein
VGFQGSFERIKKSGESGGQIIVLCFHNFSFFHILSLCDEKRCP